jgi:CO dehydrogenase maturation factor
VRADTLGIKVAVAGKGGVGKTTIAGSLARIWARSGQNVLAIDADPASHLHHVLEIPEERRPPPICEELELIEERTGARPGSDSGPFYKLNPRVNDIPEKYSVMGADGVRLLVMGTIRGAGTGCFCPENSVLRALLEHLILDREEVVVVDMEAGLEQFGRATCRNVDFMLIVVEPGARSVETAARISFLAREMGVRRQGVVANRVRDDVDRRVLPRMLAARDLNLLDMLPYSQTIAHEELEGSGLFPAMKDEGWSSAVRRLSQKISEIVADKAT